jgi:hypothetical protein
LGDDEHPVVAEAEGTDRTSFVVHAPTRDFHFTLLMGEAKTWIKYINNPVDNMLEARLLVFDQSARVMKQGFLWKRGTGFMRTWKKRWFVLQASGKVCYFRKPGDTEVRHQPVGG